MQTAQILITAFLIIVLLRIGFRKLFNLPNYSGELIADKSGLSNLMSEKEFWNILRETRDASKRNYDLQCLILTEYLKTLPPEVIVQFDRTFTVLMARSYSFKLWEAAYALNGGCSDDAFEYFRTWLIGQGKNNFYWTLKYPRALFLIGVKEMIEPYEGLAYAAYHAYHDKTGLDIPQREDIGYSDGGRMFKESEAFLRYPELALLAW